MTTIVFSTALIAILVLISSGPFEVNAAAVQDTVCQWTYKEGPHDPLKWHNIKGFEKCGKECPNQSPINFEIKTGAHPFILDEDNLYEALVLHDCDDNNKDTLVTVQKNERIVGLTFTYPTDSNCGRPFVTGGQKKMANTNWIFSAVEFHCPGEHKLDGEELLMEALFFFFNSNSYSSLEEAKKHEDGVIIISVVNKDKISSTDNDTLDGILRYFKNEATDPCKIQGSLQLSGWIKEIDPDYMAYEGTFTTPPCSPAFHYLMSNPIEMSQKQLDTICTICTPKDSNNQQPIEINNARPIQSFENRKYYVRTSQYKKVN